MRQNGISDMLQVNDVNNGNLSSLINLTNGNSSQAVAAPPVPPRSVNNNGDNLLKLVLFTIKILVITFYKMHFLE